MTALENERVAVWDVVWPKGQPSPIHEHRYAQISVTLVGGSVRVTRLDGSSTVNQSEMGSLTLYRRVFHWGHGGPIHET